MKRFFVVIGACFLLSSCIPAPEQLSGHIFTDNLTGKRYKIELISDNGNTWYFYEEMKILNTGETIWIRAGANN